MLPLEAWCCAHHRALEEFFEALGRVGVNAAGSRIFTIIVSDDAVPALELVAEPSVRVPFMGEARSVLEVAALGPHVPVSWFDPSSGIHGRHESYGL